MLKQVVVFGGGPGMDIIGNIIEDNLPVEVIKVAIGKEYAKCTESEIREWTEEKLLPYIGKVDAIVLCEPEITLSSIYFLRQKYPEQEIVGYGQDLSIALKGEHNVRVLLSHTTKRMTRYQVMKSECGDTKISESEYDLIEPEYFQKLKTKSIRSSSTMASRILDNFSGGLVIIYAPNLIFIKKQLKECVKWRATVVDLCDSLFRETCKALKFRGLDGKLVRELKG